MKSPIKYYVALAVIVSMIGMMISSTTIVHAQNVTSPNTENTTASSTQEGEMAMVLSLEDSRTGATYEYTINSTDQMAPLINSVLQAGNPVGAGTESVGDANTQQIDEFIAGISALGGAGTASLGDDAGVTGFFSKFVKTVKKGVQIATKVGPIAVKLAPLLL